MTCTIEQLEEFRLAQEIRRGKEGYEVANHGLRRKRYLQLH